VKPDGRASIRPLMEYADMSDDDVAAIISVLRSQQTVRHVVPNAEWSLLGKIIKSLAPAFRPRTPDLVHAQKASPPPATTRERGEYLVRGVGNCSGCHSPLDQLTFSLNGPEVSGGAAIEPRGIPGVDHAMWFQPPNLTPLAGSALLRFPDRETFVARFQKGGRIVFLRRQKPDGGIQVARGKRRCPHHHWQRCRAGPRRPGRRRGIRRRRRHAAPRFAERANVVRQDMKAARYEIPGEGVPQVTCCPVAALVNQDNARPGRRERNRSPSTPGRRPP
jgi:mono/diheme cytochrome c family protein